jgi:acetylornithine deacetylase
MIRGGEALNIVPAECEIHFEARILAKENGDALIEALRADAEAVVAPYRSRFAEASATIDILNAYPGLDTAKDDAAVAFVTGLLGANDLIKVDFGTEAGLFQRDLGTPTVICGPGSMEQGHKADEYIETEQMARCDVMLEMLLDRLCK